MKLKNSRAFFLAVLVGLASSNASADEGEATKEGAVEVAAVTPEGHAMEPQSWQQLGFYIDQIREIWAADVSSKIVLVGLPVLAGAMGLKFYFANAKSSVPNFVPADDGSTQAKPAPSTPKRSVAKRTPRSASPARRSGSRTN